MIPRKKSVGRRAALLWVGALAMVLLGFGARTTAWAQDSDIQESGKVYVSDKVICTITQPAAGMSANERANAVRDRLRELLSLPDISRADVRVVSKGSSAAIQVRGRLLVTVTPQDAKAERAKNAQVLAKRWANNLRNSIRYIPKDSQGEVP